MSAKTREDRLWDFVLNDSGDSYEDSYSYDSSYIPAGSLVKGGKNLTNLTDNDFKEMCSIGNDNKNRNKNRNFIFYGDLFGHHVFMASIVLNKTKKENETPEFLPECCETNNDDDFYF